ncbi:bifunctional 2-keto-4-hydroxyglutarate aldolase/2-keto-3-deoxy-6-phosphogluconate aldolase [Enterococcus sp.]|uniref:bifunctional 2-keto-4-hydroxyglutarate aldolase/2-keto-3-deoxy-6-phosphogluconate aldolase n=1 Tax=Enterococcus sp. TaxID=35783 RepID=UPI000EE26B98|nr:bifunctional 2-keto-4-hydroxyglutarate aldolase/2-keto-3-deoxy-6-phosphogluconate aldolase [Enterococcus sp.]HAB96453.1 bifunctional 2-keto-4-hydroxyglutarate aldolase/2-keto-3-deoxy-6-phosphogluconate aldolase [Enterococcus sp.]
MDKIEVIRKLGKEKLVAVIRANNVEEGSKIVEAVTAGGIKFIEITFTIPYAENLIKELVKIYANTEVVIGAGTILDSETARIAISAGAQFVVSPVFNESLIKLANRYRVPVMTGAMTPTEALSAFELGVDVVKIFPGDAFTPAIIKSFKGPLPQGLYMPTGGVNTQNVKEWLTCGAYAVGTGSSLTKGAMTGDFDAITKESASFVQAVV